MYSPAVRIVRLDESLGCPDRPQAAADVAEVQEQSTRPQHTHHLGDRCGRVGNRAQLLRVRLAQVNLQLEACSRAIASMPGLMSSPVMPNPGG
jgi:hypothetical protein